MRVLVLGHKGMLGHMVVKYLKDNNINVITIDKKYPLSSQQIKQFKGDYIINCIGAIPQKTNDCNAFSNFCYPDPKKGIITVLLATVAIRIPQKA